MANNLINELRNALKKKTEEEKKRQKLMGQINEKIEKYLELLIEIGQAFEVRHDEVLRSACATKARYIIPRDWNDVLEKMQLSEEALQKLRIKASGKDLIYWLKKAGWQQIPNTDIWVKTTNRKPIDYWLKHPEYELIATFFIYNVVLVKAKDGKVYILDSNSEEKLTDGHLDGEANSVDIILLKIRENLWESYDIRKRKFIQ